MDYSKRIGRVLRLLQQDMSSLEVYSNVLAEVIHLFEDSSKKNLSSTDCELLRIIALQIGVPTLYKMIENSQVRDFQFEASLESLSSIYEEANYYISKDIMLHKYQKEFLSKISIDGRRYFLTAPTSFGKTLLMKELVRAKEFNKVLFIFPSIALISENILDFLTEPRYDSISQNYNIISLIDENEKELYESNEKLLFILTIERYIALMSLAEVEFDFSFVDEIYKIDESMSNENIDQKVNAEESYDIGREISYRYGLHRILETSENVVLSGPYLEFEKDENRSFKNFLEENDFEVINYNLIEIVNKNNFAVKVGSRSKVNSIEIEGKSVLLNSETKSGKFVQLVTELLERGDSSLAYVSSIRMVNDYAKVLKENFGCIFPSKELEVFINHLEEKYHIDWRLIDCLKRGFGFHHGRLPKYVQKEIINFFNKGELGLLITTTTIIEGVNTVAKNMIILSSKKGRSSLNRFDALNIVGRTGRFTKHFSGRCFFMDDEFDAILNGEDSMLKHAHYSVNEEKSSSDLFIAKDKYLNEEELKKKNTVIDSVEEIGLSFEKVFNISPDIDMNLKVDILNKIVNNYKTLQNLIREVVNTSPKRYVENIDMTRFFKFFENEMGKLGLNKYMYEINTNGTYFLPFKMNQYMINGLQGMIQGYINYLEKNSSETVDHTKANRIVNDDLKLVSNVFRFELPRFLGLVERLNEIVHLESYPDTERKSLNSLIELLEYEAETTNGKKAFDFGSPRNVIRVIDGKIEVLDEYETRFIRNIRRTLLK